MKKILALMMVLCLAFAMCAPMALAEEPAEEPAEYKLGLGVSLNTNSSKAGNAQVDATTAAVVLDADGKIVAAKLDVAQNKMDVTDGAVDVEKTFLTKVELGDDYNMVKFSDATLEWYEQAAAFEQFVIGKTAEEVEAMETVVNESGHVVTTDEELYASCSISIGDFKEAVVKACRDEQGMSFTAAGEIKLGLAINTKADESTAATAEEEGVVKMYSEYAAVVVDENGVILAALTDATQPQIKIDAAGEIGEVKYGGTKRELKEGYNMVAFSDATLEWYEQAWNFVNYALGKTARELRATETVEDGSHVVFADEELHASCSISIQGMIDVVAKAADNAVGAYKLGLGVSLSTDSSKAGNAQVDATTAAVILDQGGRIVAVKLDVAQSKMDVTDGAVDTEKTFLTKVELGDDYNMVKFSDATLEWYEQAAAFEQYVIGKTADQVEAMETVVNESGHVVTTDEELYASCSISIGDFKEAVVKACRDEQGMRFDAEGEIKLGLAIITKADESTAATAEEEGVVKMYGEYAAVALDENGVILAALTDATQPQIKIDAAGEIGEVKYGGTKRELKEGYNMVAFSDATLEWYEQAWNFVNFAKGKTAEELRATETVEDGSHVVFADEELHASCSISIQGMIDVIAKAADNAAAAVEEPAAAA